MNAPESRHQPFPGCERVGCVFLMSEVHLHNGPASERDPPPVPLTLLRLGGTAERGESASRESRICLKDCIHQSVLESQLPHKTVNLLFTITN